MKVIQRIIYCGFAAVAIASASMPVFPALMHGNAFEWLVPGAKSPANAFPARR